MLSIEQLEDLDERLKYELDEHLTQKSYDVFCITAMTHAQNTVSIIIFDDPGIEIESVVGIWRTKNQNTYP